MPVQPVPRDQRTHLSWSHLLHFYTPLVLTSQLMTLSGPVINVAIGRATDPKLEFAGYWLGFTVLIFAESACLAVQQFTLAMLDERRNLRRLAASAVVIGFLTSAIVVAIALTPVGDLIFQVLIPTTARVSALARSILLHLSPIPLLIALRGVANGVAIMDRRTPLVAGATLIRVLILSGMVGSAVLWETGSGAHAGASALVSGIAAETIFIIATTARSWWRHVRDDAPGPIAYREITRVAVPIVVSMAVWTSIRPIVNAILGHLPDPELAQAGFGVVLPVVLFSCSPLWALHNVSLVLPRSRADLRRVYRFSLGMATLFAVIIGVVVLTPLKLVVLRLGFNLSPPLEASVAPALSYIALEPFFLAARAVAQGLLMKARRTEAFLFWSPAKLLLLAGIGLSVARWAPETNGATLAVLLFMGADLFDGVVYGIEARRLTVGGHVFRDSDPPAEPTAADPTD